MPRFGLLLLVLAGPTSCREHPRSSSHTDTALVYVAPSAQPAAPIPPGSPLKLDDFVVAGLGGGMDSVAVRKVLGTPDSATTQDDFRDPGAKLIAWHYRNLTVLLGSYNSLGAVRITGPGVATPRGLRLGDTSERVRELYGPPSAEGLDQWQYEYPGDAEGLTAMQISFAHGRVTAIYVGHLYD